VPFDALEFDESLATIDLGYDLAFLLMDLDRRVSRAAANRVLSRYVARTGEASLTGGLPVYLSLRAMIRAHVEAKRGAADIALGYLAAASAYLQAKRPLVLAIGGLPGSCKSTLARALRSRSIKSGTKNAPRNALHVGLQPSMLSLRSLKCSHQSFAATPCGQCRWQCFTPPA
jgi:hypothetical protein